MAAWDSRGGGARVIYGGVIQRLEYPAHNRKVVGSSPTPAPFLK